MAGPEATGKGFGRAWVGSIVDVTFMLDTPKVEWKGFGRAWVGSGAAGDPDLGPTWVQLEASWKQLGATMRST